MKNKRALFFTIIVLTVMSLLLVILLSGTEKSNTQTKRSVIHGIENFNPKSLKGDEKEYLLFYPRDSRNGQDNTIIKQVTENGKVVQEYEIVDESFRRMYMHQKPNNLNHLFISLFGEATIDNYYYTYDIYQQQFKKVDIPYFNYEVGVNHIKHYGEDVLFETLVSHLTGDQNYNAEINGFNVSISNYSRKKSFETEYGHAPKWSPLLKFQNKVIYGVAGQVKQGVYENPGIGLIDLDEGIVDYEQFDGTANELYPIYSNKDHAYILGNNGKMFVYDKNFRYKVNEPFADIPPQDMYYIESEGSLLLNEKEALYSVYSEENGFTLGILTFDTDPTFKVLNKNYLNPKNNYEILYLDPIIGNIYLLEAGENEENVLIINDDNYEIENKIPIEYSHLLDFIVELKK
ncbi:hypothetical protein [Cytobacillus sp. IB215665]|uniref:hypothetical protein n=1 Tax=Cytobacillus sp. IB215665 TaxID=3097357 RepID=UPI002A0E8F81|nr:hypothetical protein [Cytobacillus sp. IB215665]MDX8365478.1 hypothetical protein [Cytobacillus sp. IB215665]